MRNRIIFFLVVFGLLGALFSAYVYAVPSKPLPPAFAPASDPFAHGVFANGIVESYQSNGENTNLYPEVAGVVTHVYAAEGQRVTAGTVLLTLDDSVQSALAAQQKAQADAALALLEELKAQPRRENLDISRSQVDLAEASVKSANDTYLKQKSSYDIAPQSVSKDTLDTALNAARVAQANLEVVTRQYNLTKAGAWVYDVKTQERQYDALSKAYASSAALLAKYTIRAPTDGVVLSIQVAVGSYISSQGTYDTYTQGFAPVITMGASGQYLGVRCYIDEILIHRLPASDKIQAQMSIRGTNVKVPLEFVRVQPYVSPKIQLSNERTEKVDLRVLPVIFRFVPPQGTGVYPGQLVDVYVGEK